MTKLTPKFFYAAGISAISALTFVHCGNETTPAPKDNPTSSASTTNLGNFNLGCSGQSGSQQKQIPFQQQQQSGCKPHKIQFQQQQVSDYDVNLDCRSQTVQIHNKGADQKQESIPIQPDGTVKGQVQYQQQVQNDGKGNQACWIQYQVKFDGKASCKPNQQQPTIGEDNDQLALTTTVAFTQSNTEALQQLGIQGSTPSPTPSVSASVIPSPSASASASPSPSISPSPSPSPSVSPSPQPSASISPLPSPRPTLTPVLICIVDDPCPIVGSTDLSCDSSFAE